MQGREDENGKIKSKGREGKGKGWEDMGRKGKETRKGNERKLK